ncbi:tyrosine-type recombinase/integrase [Schinkia sp. CFF1]
MGKVKLMKRVELEKSIQELFDDFQLENRIKNLSEMTIRFYQQNIVHFFRYTDEIGISFVRDIEKIHIDKFIIGLKKKGIKATTINTYMRATRSFLYFAMREHYLIKFDINLIKADTEQKEPYSKEEIKKLIKKPNLKECGFVEHRNWVLVNYFLETGNRLNTVLNLKVEDIDLDRLHLVRQKF